MRKLKGLFSGLACWAACNWERRVGVLALGAALLALSAACAAPTPTPTPTPKPTPVAFANPQLMVDTEWLAQRLNDPNVRVVDVRKPADYQAGHIRNSVNLNTKDATGPMYDQSNPVKWWVVSKEEFERLMGESGIGNDTIVVAVDDDKGLWAARFFWTLEYYGHANGKARVLNGDLKKWRAEKRELTTEPAKVQKATFVARVDPAKLATKQQITDSLVKKDARILATIPEAEFKGGNEAGHLKGGHIPGAVRLDWTENLTTTDAPVFKAAGELLSQFEAVGVTKDKEVIVYCEGGIRSSVSYLALRALGYEKVRNYDGSWSEWGNDPNTSIEK